MTKTNKEKYPDEKERHEVHKQWCLLMAKIGRICDFECKLCYWKWLDRRTDNGDGK